MYKRNNEKRTRNYCCRGKSSKYYIFWVVFVALVVQHTKCVRRLILSFDVHVTVQRD